MMFRKIFLSFFLLFSQTTFADEVPYVTAHLKCQLGNNMFQVAVASALAWDHGAEPIFPELSGKKRDEFEKVLFRCNAGPLPNEVSTTWHDDMVAYSPIAYTPNMEIDGFFQSELFFAHYRERILELFAPREEEVAYIKKKYRKAFSAPCVVGVQIRRYWEDPEATLFPQYGRRFLEEAMEYFPKDALYIVSSNDIAFAKGQMPHGAHAIFLKGEEPHIDMRILSLCDHNIITNSTFGWWAAWLNQNPDKIVVCPYPFLLMHNSETFYPEGWIKLFSHWGRAEDPNSL